MNCEDYGQVILMHCENLQEDVLRVTVVLGVTILVFTEVSWLVLRVMKRMGLWG